jgi:hypothetical protein
MIVGRDAATGTQMLRGMGRWFSGVFEVGLADLLVVASTCLYRYSGGTRLGSGTRWSSKAELWTLELVS